MWLGVQGCLLCQLSAMQVSCGLAFCCVVAVAASAQQHASLDHVHCWMLRSALTPCCSVLCCCLCRTCAWCLTTARSTIPCPQILCAWQPSSSASRLSKTGSPAGCVLKCSGPSAQQLALQRLSLSLRSMTGQGSRHATHPATAARSSSACRSVGAAVALSRLGRTLSFIVGVGRMASLQV